MRSAWGKLAFVAPALLLVACDGKEKEELAKRYNETADKLLQCRKDTNDLTNEVAGLKRQLAQAMANPSKVTLNDPEIINLIASIRGGSAGAPGDEVTLGKGSLNPKEASKIVMQGAMALRQCYERALKKNQALQYQSGLAITLALTVKPQGAVQGVEVVPSVDHDMTTCIKTAAMRWKFPTFAGSAVTIEQKLTLTPSKS
jgi:hypothetical protein